MNFQNENSRICIGLEHSKEIHSIIIRATHEMVCAYKLNFAFYDSIHDKTLLKKTIAYIRSVNNDIPIIGDLKQCDVPHMSKLNAVRVFETYGLDAVTLNPYMGFDSIEPFIEYKDKYIFVVCKTSNKSSVDLQDVLLKNNKKLYEHVADLAVNTWNKYSNIGLVMGGTYIDDIQVIRNTYPNTLLLIPGIGSQGGSTKEVMKVAKDNFIINVSRSVVGKDATAIRNKIKRLRLDKISNM